MTAWFPTFRMKSAGQISFLKSHTVQTNKILNSLQKKYYYCLCLVAWRSSFSVKWRWFYIREAWSMTTRLKRNYINKYTLTSMKHCPLLWFWKICWGYKVKSMFPPSKCIQQEKCKDFKGCLGEWKMRGIMLKCFLKSKRKHCRNGANSSQLTESAALFSTNSNTRLTARHHCSWSVRLKARSFKAAAIQVFFFFF